MSSTISNFNQTMEPNTITFMIEGEEIIKLTKDGFYYLGEHVKDPFDVYIRFHEYLKLSNI